MNDNIHVIILAGGKGKRMNADCPKVLIDFMGEPIITRILRAVTPINAHPSIIVGHKGEEVVVATEDKYQYIWQADQLGTGHAVLQAKPFLMNEPVSAIMVLNGDHPLLTEQTIRGLAKSHGDSGAPITITTVRVPSFEGDNRILNGYGRVLRGKDNAVQGIRELKDASAPERAITEVNVGYYAFQPAWLWQHIEELENKNEAKEYYVTDLVGVAAKHGERINAYALSSPAEAMGVNTKEELEIAKKYART